ncbi:protein zyg-11 homolog B-like [Pomacea canaliculata]|uniref:protein zyg-11 homolog B-like n=1 Tax=Pomacea canaliculata TaxID=400727 RepID=UPI000D736009|nr:protein zyg-11 homolog B-like [Pomacea canaliculata]XP_025110003.1 protein zyg-11 homolog B-like [Pomacea canaliculata]
MYDTPISLQECCVDFICDNLAALCDIQTPENKQNRLVFKDAEVCFHSDLSEQLLTTLCSKGKLNDEVLGLFDSNGTTLRRVSIHDAQVTTKGLRVLKSHRISELEITGLKGVPVNDLIGCLGEWTLTNLRVLNVSNNTFLNNAKFCVVVSLSKLKNLHSLNVSFTEFNTHGLEIIAEDLPCLENLDISSTLISDISSLRKCKDRLKMLSMYNLQLSNNDEVVTVLCELAHLRHLDVSSDALGQSFMTVHQGQFRVSSLLERTSAHPQIVSLDISGRDEVPEPLLRCYLETHAHLQFLGLSLTRASEYSLFMESSSDCSSHIVVTGEASVPQLMEALRRYVNRSVYIQKTLFRLFTFSQGFVKPREDIIKLVLPGMKMHPKQLGVQMAATACLYNLTKGELGPRIHPACLQQVVNLTLQAMENFPNHQQLQKNALLTLCSDRILQDVTFDRFHCAKLVMECLCAFEDISMNRMSVAICSILAAKISTEQTSVLGSKPRYMRKLLSLVKSRMETQNFDITLKFTLSALWNLTDESPPTCGVFLSEQGLDLFMNMLQSLGNVEAENRVQVETKILGLLNNIAEVKTLRQDLMREDFIMLVRQLLRTTHIDVSYFAAGIIAHLASDGEEAWRDIAGMQRADILEELGEVVAGWEQPQGEMVAYRSFSPFFPLLDCFDTPSVQLWAVWAIQHVCTKNGDRYCPLLQEEGGVDRIHRLIMTHNADSSLSQISSDILDRLSRHVRAR